MEILIIYFLLSMVVTFSILYIFSPNPQVILKYPNHKQDKSRLYKDDNGVCYRYKTKIVTCPNKN